MYFLRARIWEYFKWNEKCLVRLYVVFLKHEIVWHCFIFLLWFFRTSLYNFSVVLYSASKVGDSGVIVCRYSYLIIGIYMPFEDMGTGISNLQVWNSYFSLSTKKESRLSLPSPKCQIFRLSPIFNPIYKSYSAHSNF